MSALVNPFQNPLVGSRERQCARRNLRTLDREVPESREVSAVSISIGALIRNGVASPSCPAPSAPCAQVPIEAAGGFSNDTLAEDTDLTLTLHRLGYRIDYAPAAVAWTEAPETLGTLA